MYARKNYFLHCTTCARKNYFLHWIICIRKKKLYPPWVDSNRWTLVLWSDALSITLWLLGWKMSKIRSIYTARARIFTLLGKDNNPLTIWFGPWIPKDCILQSQVMLFFMGSFGSKFDNGNLCANKNWTFFWWIMIR